MCVVLSYVRTLNGLYLVRHLKLSDIVPPSRQYLSFVQRMKKHADCWAGEIQGCFLGKSDSQNKQKNCKSKNYLKSQLLVPTLLHHSSHYMLLTQLPVWDVTSLTALWNDTNCHSRERWDWQFILELVFLQSVSRAAANNIILTDKAMIITYIVTTTELCCT